MMRKTTIILLVLVFSGKLIFAQNTLSETEKLVATAKVWGFLKYYHPEVADGKYNWDQQLFEILPKVKNATDKEQLSKVYIDWIESLGTVKPCKKCEPPKGIQYFDKNFDLSWLNNDQIFTSTLSDKLKYIEDNRHQGKKHQVAYFKGKPKLAYFTNELEYKDFDWQDENLRLLTMFRYWNMVEYFFPAKYQTDTNWNDVLNKMIPKFLNPKSEKDFHLAMLELSVNLDDSHAIIRNKKNYCHLGCYNIPAKFKLIESKAIITGFYNDSLAKINDLKIGDIIIKVNDQGVETIFKEKEKYIFGSNVSRKRINANYYMFSGSTNSVKAEIIRDGKTSTKSIKRYLYKDFNSKNENDSEEYKILEGNIGYINIGEVETKEVPKVMEALKNTKAIIFDIRKSKGSTPYFFTNYITSQKRDFQKAIYPDLDYPGRYIWAKTGRSGNAKLAYSNRVVLLVDEYVQSQLETNAKCLQVGDNVTTIGRQTSGADGNVIIFNTVSGFKTQMSGIGIFYPDGTETQRKGVKIDIEVNPTLEGIIAGKDEILERAIKFVNQ